MRAAGPSGRTIEALAADTGCHPAAVRAWAVGADAQEIATLDGGTIVGDDDVAVILLDEERPEYLGGQFVHAAVASLDWGGMVDFFRTDEPIRERPERYRIAIERLTAQDIAVFFQEALAELPQLVADLGRGGRVVDIHCGGGRWLIAMARRFPGRARRRRGRGGFGRPRPGEGRGGGPRDRITIRQTGATKAGELGEFDLAYFQYALHQLTDAPAALRAAWAALRPGGRILVLDWPLPSSQEEAQSRQGALIAGVQLDELYQGTALVSREQYLAWFSEADVPRPVLVDLPSGASMFVAQRD